MRDHSMTFRTDPEFDEDETAEAVTPGNWVAAAAAVSVLIIATITLTIVAGGWELSTVLFG